MDARNAKLVFGGFVGLAAAITFNALALQTGRHPAPMKTASVSQEAAAPVSKSSERQASERARVKAIQRELTTKGYDPGPVDATMGLFTRAAIMAYETDQGLPLIGEPSPELLEHIVLGESVMPVANPSAPPAETVALIKAVQQILTDQGYDPGTVDGVIGAGTIAAIKAFERDRSLAESGRISGKLLRKIIGATGAKITTSSFD
jgi:peptidoglycan hydrolase-like protein with peptidoglycan-binding domain